MAIELVEVTKNTRGVNSREIKYMAIGRWSEKSVERESKPIFNEDGTPKLDSKGNQEREPLGKDENGKLITITELVPYFESDGVLQKMEDALELVNYDEQVLLDCFAEGFNDRQYSKEADKDELDDFLATMELNDEQKATFKKTARQINRGYGLTLLEAAEQVQGMMEKAKAKLLAAQANKATSEAAAAAV